MRGKHTWASIVSAATKLDTRMGCFGGGKEGVDAEEAGIINRWLLDLVPAVVPSWLWLCPFFEVSL